MGSTHKINPYFGRLVYAVDAEGRCVFSRLLVNRDTDKRGNNAKDRRSVPSGGSAGGTLQTMQRSEAGRADPLHGRNMSAPAVQGIPGHDPGGRDPERDQA